jgi:hypothetical protein
MHFQPHIVEWRAKDAWVHAGPALAYSNTDVGGSRQENKVEHDASAFFTYLFLFKCSRRRFGIT